MADIGVLDCTLREGGYVNDWQFGESNILKIVEQLDSSGIEYIECGFLKPKSFNNDYSIYNSFKELENFIPKSINAGIALMINYGEVPIELIPENISNKLYIRTAFKKRDRQKAIEYCRQLKDKGYKIFVNAMASNSYTEPELTELIEQVNILNPYAYTMSDTLGNMQKNDIISLFKFLDKNLFSDIILAFHPHNNMQLAVSNSQLFLEMKTSRKIIIDSTLMGMGRGAGNLSTEMIVRYLNFKYDKKYKSDLILNLAEDIIQPICKKRHWGYTVPYYLTAANGCHPNYAKYLCEEKGVSAEILDKLLKMIPDDKKIYFDKEFAENLWSKNNINGIIIS